MTKSEKSTPEKSKPIHEIRLGSVRAAIWKNETQFGSLYNVTISRLYKEGDQWRSTDSFGRDDLLLIGKVADLAHSWIYEQPRESAAGPMASEDDCR